MLKLYPYQPKFKKIFHYEKRRLRKVLGSSVLIEHFGSSAVPGLLGKGVIDIILGFRTKKETSAAIPKLVALGYRMSTSNQKTRGERIFLSSSQKESRIGDIHLHLVTKDSPDLNSVLNFRDKLIKNKSLRMRYAEAKKQAAKLSKGNRDKYKLYKSAFLKQSD